MTSGTKTTTLFIAAITLLLSGCGKKEPEMTKDDIKAIVEEEAKKSQAESDKSLESKIAAGLADAKKDSEAKLAAAKEEIEAKAKKEIEEKLAAQKEEITAQFEARNKVLRDQVDSLTSKFNSLKSSLPTEVVEPFMEKLPELVKNVDSLESLVSQFSPTTLAQVEEFKNKYEKEIAIATKISDELMKLLANTKLGDTLKKIPGM